MQVVGLRDSVPSLKEKLQVSGDSDLDLLDLSHINLT